MGDGKWEVGNERREGGDGRGEMRNERREIGGRA